MREVDIIKSYRCPFCRYSDTDWSTDGFHQSNKPRLGGLKERACLTNINDASTTGPNAAETCCESWGSSIQGLSDILNRPSQQSVHRQLCPLSPSTGLRPEIAKCPGGLRQQDMITISNTARIKVVDVHEESFLSSGTNRAGRYDGEDEGGWFVTNIDVDEETEYSVTFLRQSLPDQRIVMKIIQAYEIPETDIGEGKEATYA